MEPSRITPGRSTLYAVFHWCPSYCVPSSAVVASSHVSCIYVSYVDIYRLHFTALDFSVLLSPLDAIETKCRKTNPGARVGAMSLRYEGPTFHFRLPLNARLHAKRRRYLRQPKQSATNPPTYCPNLPAKIDTPTVSRVTQTEPLVEKTRVQSFEKAKESSHERTYNDIASEKYANLIC